jgi:purine-binding chemotaxis protein CheW
MTENQFIMFRVGREKYGVNINEINTISAYIDITKSPNSHQAIEGMINLRGSIIPVINLHKYFNVDPMAIGNDTRIIICNLSETTIGFLTDEASKVIKVNNQNIEKTPSLITTSETEYITGICKYNDELITLLSFEHMISNII